MAENEKPIETDDIAKDNGIFTEKGFKEKAEKTTKQNGNKANFDFF